MVRMSFATLGGVLSRVSNGPGRVEDRGGVKRPGYSSTSSVTEFEIKFASATISAIPFGAGVEIGGDIREAAVLKKIELESVILAVEMEGQHNQGVSMHN